jgi:hypothetical protein
MTFNIFLCRHDCEKNSENSKLSGSLTTFVKQGAGAKNGKMWFGQYYLAESRPRT